MWTRQSLLLLCCFVCLVSNEERRQKRYLLFTESSQWGAFVTVAIPLHPDTTVSVAWFFEAAYYNVDNVTYFQPLLYDVDTISRNRKDRAIETPFLTRSLLYGTIELFLERHGFPPSCLLRAICENAESHFLHNGVLGDVLHLILTPSTSMQEIDLEDYYYEAEFLGLEKQCHHYTEGCPHSVLDLISIYISDVKP